MARGKGLLHAHLKAKRDAERHRIAEARAEQAAIREAAASQRALERSQRAQDREAARLYVESRVTEAESQSKQLDQYIAYLNGLLAATLSVDDYFDLQTLKQTPEAPPVIETYLPPNLSYFRKLWPGAIEKHAQEAAEARERYEIDLAAHQTAVQQVADYNAEVDDLERAFTSGDPSAVVNYFTLVLEASSYPDNFPRHAKLAYVPESKQLVVEYDLPPFEVVPEVAAFKYVKAKDEVVATQRPVTHRKAIYSSAVAQIALRTLHELFEADRLGHLETIVLNCYVDAIDRGTGRPIRPCLVTIRTSRDTFSQLDLSRVDPIACLKALNASFSKSPGELSPVRPVLEFSMVDPRFIQETDVLSTLDDRPNLMELTPGEFESLITNLFEKMGLETRQTQASRDGGVDCVAYDPRPIFGGKVIIQAKRYSGTVGVSAVRDLFGAVHNEGASKGILVTTSGFGKASFEFAEGKPLELLSGSHLLYLLAHHAGVEARIEVTDTWQDPKPDNDGA